MSRTTKSKQRRTPKTVLKLPDLEQSKSAVLNSLSSPSSQGSYDHAIREFIDWYCSELRLACNKTVETWYRISLEQRQYAPSTINLRLAAVRRLAYEASDCGLLSPDLAAGIRKEKGARQLGVRIGNRLTTEEGRRLACVFGASTSRERRNRAMIAVLVGCGLRRAEAGALKLEDLQLREADWVIADLNRKGGHIRTVPMPGRVKRTIDDGAVPAGITSKARRSPRTLRPKPTALKGIKNA
jgi:site-specific recombinase XerD